jgi:hypothetical protein
MTMLRFALLAGLALAGTAHAQAYRCTGADGKVTYSQAPCPGGRQLDQQQLQSNTIDRTPAPTAPGGQRRERPAQAVVIGGSKPGCPDETAIRNLEVSASSITIDRYEKAAQAEQVRRARACQPLMTDSEFQARKEAEKRDHAKSLPPGQRPLNCQPNGIGGMTCF